MKSLFAAIALLPVSAFASPSNYECLSVGGTDEWRVSINLTEKQASFFDNDTESYVSLKDVRSLETLPPQLVYTFEGLDQNGRSDSTLRISFNETRMTGSVTFNAGTADEETVEAEGGCVISENQ